MTVLFYLAISAQPAHARPSSAQPQRGPRPARARARALLAQLPAAQPRGALSPAPRPQPGPGPGIRPRAPIPPGLRRWPDHLRPSIQIERWSAQLGASKTPAGRASLNPSSIFIRTFSLFASLLSLSLLSQTPSERQRRSSEVPAPSPAPSPACALPSG